eukprot:3325357-Rhodomonas_salina.1
MHILFADFTTPGILESSYPGPGTPGMPRSTGKHGILGQETRQDFWCLPPVLLLVDSANIRIGRSIQ